MEPGILDVLRRYLELGGSAQNGVDFLIDKYVGTYLQPVTSTTTGSLVHPRETMCMTASLVS